MLYEVAAWTGLRWGELRALRLGRRELRAATSTAIATGRFTARRRHEVRQAACGAVVGPGGYAAPRSPSATTSRPMTDYVLCTDQASRWATTLPPVASRPSATEPASRAPARTTTPTFHDLRHSYGTLSAAISADLRQVQEYMADAAMTTTEISAHFVPRAGRRQPWHRASRAMLDLFKPCTPTDAPNKGILGPTGANGGILKWL